MDPLTEEDLELAELLWRNFDAEEFTEYLDSRDAMDEAEAMELADGAKTRPFEEVL